MDRPLPWLRYLDADDIDDQTVDFDGLKVRNAQMETLGKVEGFIVDSQTARPYYVVVDAGGWFKSKHYLLPVGHAKIDDDNDALVVDLSKERIERFPGFDKDTFEKMSEDDIKRFNDDTLSATGATTTTSSSTTATSSAGFSDAAGPSYAAQWGLPQYAMPSWWSAGPVLSDPVGSGGFSSDVAYAPSKVTSTTPRPEPVKTYTADEVTATPVEVDTDATTPVTLANTSGDAPAAKRLNEDSPFFDGRAQPGDVLGLDTGGERTYVGETAEDENKRREAAEEAVRNQKNDD